MVTRASPFNLSNKFLLVILLTFLIISPELALAQTPFIREKPSPSFKAVIPVAPEICAYGL